MKILSRNVNWIRAVAKKWFVEWMAKEDPDVLCLQETKAFSHQLTDELLAPHWYSCTRHAGTRAWYAGTAIYTRSVPSGQMSSFSDECFHADGRVTQVEYNWYTIINAYFPNGWTRADGTEMLTYKLAFYDTMIAHMNHLRAEWKKVVLVWDLNIAHTEIDLARPKSNTTSIGFLPIEREKISELFSHGYVDVFRHNNPEEIDEYTRWAYRAWARDRNVGWRIDYAVIDNALLDEVQSFRHRQDVMWSDHCPVEIVLKDK